jgi:hypothetical protein
MHNAKIGSAKSSSARSDIPKSKTGGFDISRGSYDLGKIATTELEDWRVPLVCYLENLGHVIDGKVRWQALKYILLDHDLYRQTIDGLLLRYLGSDQYNIDMGEFMIKFALHISWLI